MQVVTCIKNKQTKNPPENKKQDNQVQNGAP